MFVKVFNVLPKPNSFEFVLQLEIYHFATDVDLYELDTRYN